MHQNMNTYPHRINVNLVCPELFNQVLYANATEIINHYMSSVQCWFQLPLKKAVIVSHSVLSNSYWH